jgi:hypothetical protein
MTYIAVIRYFDGSLAEIMIAMRTWLDRRRIEAERFDCCSGCPGLAFRVAFKDKDHAASFAAAFGGHVEGADPDAAGPRWLRAPSAGKTDERADAEPPGRPHRPASRSAAGILAEQATGTVLAMLLAA